MTDQEYHNKQIQYMRKERKANQLCTRCGKQDAYTINNHSLCFECNEKEKERDRRRNKTEKRREWDRQRRENDKANGICIQCHKRKAEPGKVTCMRCLIKARQRDQKRREKNRPEATGDCVICKKNNSTDGYKICSECFARLNQSREKALEKLKELRASGELIMVKNRYNEPRYQRKDNMWITVNSVLPAEKEEEEK